MPAHHMPTGYGPTSTALGPHVPGPDVSGRTAPPQARPVNPVHSPSLHECRVPEFGAAEQPLKDIIMKNQRGSWLSRFLFPEEELANAQEKTLSDVPVANLQTRRSVYHGDTRSPDRPRAPIAPMYEGDPLPDIPDCRCNILLFVNRLVSFLFTFDISLLVRFHSMLPISCLTLQSSC